MERYYHPQQSSSLSPAELAAHRANLIAGLRTAAARPRTESVEAVSLHHVAQQLQASAPTFTPGGPHSPSPHSDAYKMDSLQQHFAALQMSAMQSTPNIAASYGATQGQPQHQQRYDALLRQRHQQQRLPLQRQSRSNENVTQQSEQNMTQQDVVAQFLRHRQAQQDLFQRQMLAQQHLEALRLQASSAHHDQQQHVAQQQRDLFAQIQAEYDQQVQRQQQQQVVHEQRQAAQASIQANLRSRQAQRLYAQLVQDKMNGNFDHQGHCDLWQMAVNAVEEHHAEEQTAAAAASLADTQEKLRLLQTQQYQLQLQQYQQQQHNCHASDATQRVANERSSSPQHTATQRLPSCAVGATPRERGVSYADKAVSWRTRTSAMTASGPAVSIDDNSENESPSARSSRSFNSADETPQTSEEDMRIGALAATFSDKTLTGFMAQGEAKVSSTLTDRHENRQVSGSTTSLAPPRVSSYSPGSRPTSKAFGSESSAASTPVSIIVIQPCRQPRGPPADFQPSNFTTRANARTRKDALNRLRLCSSPRVVTEVVA